MMAVQSERPGFESCLYFLISEDVTLVKSQDLSESQFAHLEWGHNFNFAGML